MYIFFTRWPSNSCSSTIYLLQLGGIVLRTCILVTLFIKISSYTDMDVISMFWAFWCSLSIQIVILFFCLMMTITMLIRVCTRSISCADSYGAIWSLIASAGFLTATLNAVLQIVSYEKKRADGTKALVLAFIPFISFLFLLYFLTLASVTNLT